MAQTTVIGYYVAPSGHRFVTQDGTHGFGNTTKVTLSVNLRRLVAAFATPEQAPSSKHTSMVGSFLPYISASHLAIGGIPTPYRVIVSRLHKNMAALKFSYSLIGW
jgi:hypothetical protein